MKQNTKAIFIQTVLVQTIIGFTVICLTLFNSASPILADTVNNEEIESSTAAGSYLAARFATSDFDFKTSAKLLEEALEFASDDEAVRRSLMATYLQSGEFEKAASIAQDFTRDPILGRIARLISYTNHMKANRFTAAIGALNIEKPQDNMPVEILMDQLLLSWALSGQGKIDEALDQIDQLSQGSQAAVIGWYPLFTNYHKGLLLEIAGRNSEAKLSYTAAIEHPRATATALDTVLRSIEALVRIYVKDGELDEARQVLDAGFEIIGNHPPFQALDKNLSEIGKQAFITNSNEGAADVFYVLGKAIDRDGGEDFVNQLYRLGETLDPKHDPMRLARAGLLQKLERYEDANAIYQSLSENSSFITRAEIQMALNFDAMKDVDQSVSIMRGVIEREPDNQTAVLSLAGTLMRADRYEQAVSVLDRFLNAKPKLVRQDWAALYRRGIALDQVDRWQDAEANFLKALEVFPDQPEVLNYLGYTWIDKGENLEDGLEMLERAVSLSPNTGYIIDSLGWAHYRLENFDMAVRYLEEAVLLMPTDPTILDHLGDAYWQVGRHLEARYKWAQALDSKPDDDVKIKIEAKLQDGLVKSHLKKATLNKNPEVSEEK